MATYVNDLRLKEIATGDESGTWGASTNTNLELIAEAFSYGTEAITTNADTHTTTIADGSTDPGRSIYLKYTGTLDSACTITIGPNTVSKLWFIENATSGSQNIIISQGSGANITIPAGDTKVVYSDGAGSGAAFFDAFANLKVTDPAQTNITSLGTLTTLTVDDITINGSTISDGADLTLDAGGDIILDADGTQIILKDGGTEFGHLYNTNSDFGIKSTISDKDIKFVGNDGGSIFTALTLDMSEAGAATFNGSVLIPNQIVHVGDADTYLQFSGADDWRVVTGNAERFSVNNSAVVINEESGDMDFRVESNGNANMLFVDGGNNRVGIGTNSPTEDLTIASTSPQIRFEDTDASGTPYSKVSGVLGNIYIQADDGNEIADSKIDFRVDGTQRMVIDSSGQVGIGTSSPDADLSLLSPVYSSGGTGNGIRFQNQNNNADAIIQSYYSGTSSSALFFAANAYVSTSPLFTSFDNTKASCFLLANTNGSVEFGNAASGNPTTKMLLNSSGNVGIGTSSPSAPLDAVTNSTVYAGKFTQSNTSNGDGVLVVVGSTAAADYALSVRSDAGNTSVLAAKADGNVGIGTFSPSTMLHIENSSGNASAQLTSGTSGTSYINMGDTGNVDAGQISYINNGDAMAFTANASERMRIDANGYLLIRAQADLFDSGQLQLTSAQNMTAFYVANTGFAAEGNMVGVERGASSAYSFAQYYSGRRSDNGGGDREFNFRGDGNAYADGSFNNSGADYAEYFESHTGSAIPRGTSVVLENNKVRAATSEDNVADIIGVVRPKEFGKNSMVIGNTAWNMWSEKYLTDDFNCYVMEDYSVVSWNDEDGELVTYESDNIPSDVTPPDDAETNTHDENGVKFQRRALNPNFDDSLTYEPREDRDEWIIVGLIGQVQILDGQPTNDRWVKMRDISDTVKEWYIR